MKSPAMILQASSNTLSRAPIAQQSRYLVLLDPDLRWAVFELLVAEPDEPPIGDVLKGLGDQTEMIDVLEVLAHGVPEALRENRIAAFTSSQPLVAQFKISLFEYSKIHYSKSHAFHRHFNQLS
jgi:hypothetical protein